MTWGWLNKEIWIWNWTNPLSERKQVGENNVCQYYIFITFKTFCLKGIAFLIIGVINVNKQNMLNKCLLVK